MSLKSMTGFGSATVEAEAFFIKVEIKSLNGKFLELKCRMPRSFYHKEIELRNYVSPKLVRGTVSIHVNVEPKSTKNLSQIEVNLALAKEYKEKLSLLIAEVGENETSTWKEIVKMPDVVTSSETTGSDEDWIKLVEATDAALEQFNAFRTVEGDALQKHFTECIDSIDAHFTEVKSHLEDRRTALKDRIYGRIEESIEESLIDKNRLEQEIILYLEKYDITEEIKRLEGHLVHFRESLNSTDSNGKKLGFLSQELGREINTMGVKANYLPMQKEIVGMKESLEMIKEQVLNTL